MAWHTAYNVIIGYLPSLRIQRPLLLQPLSNFVEPHVEGPIDMNSWKRIHILEAQAFKLTQISNALHSGLGLIAPRFSAVGRTRARSCNLQPLIRPQEFADHELRQAIEEVRSPPCRWKSWQPGSSFRRQALTLGGLFSTHGRPHDSGLRTGGLTLSSRSVGLLPLGQDGRANRDTRIGTHVRNQSPVAIGTASNAR